MIDAMRTASPLRETTHLAGRALRSWTPREVWTAAVATVTVALLVGVPTVLIPNPVFGREIAPVWWNYPIWIATSILSGLLLATYVRPRTADDPAELGSDDPASPGAGERRTSRVGIAGAALTWFAVGCPVCNKLVLVAVGYSGALAWFAPAQPFLAAAAVAATTIALLWRLRGQVACPATRRLEVAAR